MYELEQINVVLSVADCFVKRLPRPYGLAMTDVNRHYWFVIANEVKQSQP